MTAATRAWFAHGAVFLLFAAGACGGGSGPSRPSATGGQSGSGAAGSGGSGGEIAGSGGTATGGSGGSVADAASVTGGEDASATTPDAGQTSDGAVTIADGGMPPMTTPPGDYGGVGQSVPIPIQYSPTPIPPIVPPDCPGDPTQGFTEYMDTFVIQRPYDLAAAARFSIMDGIYTFFVNSTDKPHEPGNTTAPRTEARYSNFSTGEHMWTGDVLLDSPLSRTCIMQTHNVQDAIAVYLRVTDGRMFNLGTGATILPAAYGKWFNLKVDFDTQSRQVKVYVNNCLKETSTGPSGPTPNWYFKNGVYTCDTGTCRDHYKNIHLYQK